MGLAELGPLSQNSSTVSCGIRQKPIGCTTEMVLQAALGSLLLHQEKVGILETVLSHLRGPGEILYDGS